MFWLLNGATLTPARAHARHRPVTTNDLPASELVPATSRPAMCGDFTVAGVPRRTVESDDAGVQVHLVRHGQSTWNRVRRVQGQTVHPDLTELGRSQAATAAATLVRTIDGPAALWSSDLVRAARTAQIIGRALRTPVQYDEALREQYLGAMQGRPVGELRSEPTPQGRHVSEVRWGGGESTADVAARFARFAARELSFLSTRTKHLILVSHGDTIRVALAVLSGTSHRELDWRPIGNGSVHTVTVPQTRRDETR